MGIETKFSTTLSFTQRRSSGETQSSEKLRFNTHTIDMRGLVSNYGALFPANI